MALFTDGTVSSMDDLTAQDSQLLDVASNEGIDVTRKLALAQAELGLELEAMLGRLAGFDQPFWCAQPPSINQVVITSPLRLWHVYRTLELVYRDAYNNQLNDRYGAKRDQFHELGRWAWEKLILAGVGIAADAVPQAATPLVTAAAGSLADGTYYVTSSWVNREGDEGASATPAIFMTSENTLLVQPGVAPANAVGWNVYVGTTPEAMVLQNATAIDVMQSWIQPGALVTVGRGPGAGQTATYMRAIPRAIQRG
ncbi:MAG TPA: hypothetical protein VG675_18025 [Bryobacteraceae bacterium]|nr:hypothetical protein [Bryobacteraceae bacterium]